jgi:hypothetical protein
MPRKLSPMFVRHGPPDNRESSEAHLLAREEAPASNSKSARHAVSVLLLTLRVDS